MFFFFKQTKTKFSDHKSENVRSSVFLIRLNAHFRILKKQNLENYKKSGKIYVTKIEKIIETLCSVYDLIKLFLINKNDNDIEHNHSLIREEINLDERI